MKSVYYEKALGVIGDSRGALVAIEESDTVPFDIKRVYYIFNNSAHIRRGLHAHRESKQVLICVAGSCDVEVEDSSGMATVTLDSPSKMLYLEGLVWHEMINFSRDAVLLVLADRHYDESDYIRSYQEFIELLKTLD